MKKLRITFILVSIIILIVINSVYYYSTKTTLEKHQEEKVELIVSNVKNSINSSNGAQEYFNIFLSQQLRKSAVGIKHALPAKISDVTNEQLVLLAKELNLEGISLFVQKGDDIVVEKSSSPYDIGVSTKTWGNWHLMLQQLFKDHKVTPIEGYGESAENFWAGPIGTSLTDEDLTTKWGYFYDGTTDYMITPFIDDALIKKFDKNAGVNKTIERIIEYNPGLLEIAVLNREVLKTGEKKRDGVVWLFERLVWYGTYQYQHEKDKILTEKTIEKGHRVKEIIHHEDKKVLKYYVPIKFKKEESVTSPLIIIVSTDYQVIQSELNKKIFHTFLTSLFCLIFGFFILYFFVRIINKKERTIFNVQEMYSGHIETLYRTVRENRHDANHHLYTIAGLVKLELHDELAEYVNKLLEIKTCTNDIINVNIPAFSGLLQAKVAEAIEKRITFEHHFEHFELLQFDMLKVTNLVRVVGNILDNAFHAVMEKPEDSRKVVITGRYQNGKLSIKVYNNGEPIPPSHLYRIFSHGFTTKVEKGGKGLGLSSSKKIIESYKGTLTVSSDEDWTNFSIQLPVSPKEVIE